MIIYDESRWAFICTLYGSVVVKSCKWAAPAAGLAMGANIVYRELNSGEPVSNTLFSATSSMTFALAFLLVFRTQTAYSRYWQGATLMRMVRGQWFNATQSLFAFCSTDPSLACDVEHFQHHLTRLVSMLFCAAFQQLAQIEDQRFEVISYKNMDAVGIQWLGENHEEKTELVLQWIMRLIVEQERAGVVDIAPPILSRVFQEFSNGMVQLDQARTITDVPFPFPYAQIITILLWIYSAIVPVVFAVVLEQWFSAGVCAFVTVLMLWSINYVAMEIEMPYGMDPNDLNLKEVQVDLNRSLVKLLDPRTQTTPGYTFTLAEKAMAIDYVDLGPAAASHSVEDQRIPGTPPADHCGPENDEPTPRSVAGDQRTTNVHEERLMSSAGTSQEERLGIVPGSPNISKEPGGDSPPKEAVVKSQPVSPDRNYGQERRASGSGSTLMAYSSNLDTQVTNISRRVASLVSLGTRLDSHILKSNRSLESILLIASQLAGGVDSLPQRVREYTEFLNENPFDEVAFPTPIEL